jgi:hypothetical protein
MPSTPTPLRYGRRAPKNAPALKFARMFTGKVPAHPAAADYLARLAAWQMLGNDQAGDCVAVTWANVRRLISSIAGAENYPSQDEVWAVYQTQNPDFAPNGAADTNGPGSNADGGMDIQTLLEYLHKTGGPDGKKVLAFAKVDPTAPDEVKAAISIFGFVWTGIVVQNANMDDFNNGRPWDYHRSSPDDGGHSVITGGYDIRPGRRPTNVHHPGPSTTRSRPVLGVKADNAWVVVVGARAGHAATSGASDLRALACRRRRRHRAGVHCRAGSGAFPSSVARSCSGSSPG